MMSEQAILIYYLSATDPCLVVVHIVSEDISLKLFFFSTFTGTAIEHLLNLCDPGDGARLQHWVAAHHCPTFGAACVHSLRESLNISCLKSYNMMKMKALAGLICSKDLHFLFSDNFTSCPEAKVSEVSASCIVQSYR